MPKPSAFQQGKLEPGRGVFMCGIVGYSGEVPAGKLSVALSRIAHRGPDDEGVFVSRAGDCALGHRRLAIIDTSTAGHQPMVSHDGRFVIVYNGEIYNYREIRRNLEATGVQFRSTSDTEVLLELFSAYGISGLDLLDGMYAFAIYDNAERRLLLARDEAGIKPLYFFSVDGVFGFASELKALIPLLPSEPTLDPAAINRYLRYLWCPGDGTPFREIRKSRPGEMMIIEAGSVVSRTRRTHGLRTCAVAPPDGFAPILRAELEAAVHRQLVSDVPVGSFLSGGLDSSAVVAFAARHHPSIACYTIDQEGGGDDGVPSDLPYATAVANHIGVPLHVVRLRASALREELPAIISQLDEPQADPAALAVLEVARCARRDGIKVLLSGVGGDDLFSGYRRHQALYWSERIGPAPPWMATATRAVVAHLDHRKPWVRQLARVAESASVDMRAQTIGLFSWVRDSVISDLFVPGMRSEIDRGQAESPFLDFLAKYPRGGDAVRECLALEQEFFLPDHNLAYTDRMSMSVGVEVRVPFLDRSLVALARSLPSQELMHFGSPKRILKKAMKGLLPDQVISRKKVGFGAPIRRWIRRDLRDMVYECLSPERIRARGLFDERRVHDLLMANDSGRIDAAYPILALVCVELWLRQYVDGAFAWRRRENTL